MHRFIRPLFLAVLLPCLLVGGPARAAISGQESSVSALSGIDDSTLTYDTAPATASTGTLSQQYENTISEIYANDARIAALQAHLNTQGGTPAETAQYRAAYFQAINKSTNLRNKARALDSLISGQKLSDAVSHGQVLDNEQYNTIKTRLDALDSQAASNQKELDAMEDRLNSGEPTASLSQYELLYKENMRINNLAHSLREVLNNSVYPDGTPSVADLPTTTGGINNGNSGNSSQNSSKNNIAQGIAQGIANSLMGGGGMNSFGNIQNMIGGLQVAGTNVAPVKAATRATTAAEKPKPVKQDSTAGDKDCDNSGNAAAAKAALPERDDSGKIIKSSGNATTDTAPGKAADDVLANKPAGSKPACKGVDYTKKNPEGTDGSSMNGSKITSLEDMEAQIAAQNGQCVFDGKSSSGNRCECPSLVKANSDLGPTSGWTKGEQVWGNNDLAIGTPIATFCNGSNSYVNGNAAYGCSHTGLYAGQDSENLYVYNQFNSSGGPKISKIPKNAWNGHPEEGGIKFYTINGGQAFLFGIPFYLQYTLRALSVWPEGEGLAKTTNPAYTVL